jgi:ubiquinol-cytochrome c reductase cytochrome b subunit
VGGATLSRFFAFHVFFIPAIIFAFLGAHLFLVIRNGISEPPKIGDPVNPKTYRKNYHDLLEREGVPFWPDALWRDAVAAVIVIVAVIILAIVVGPPVLGNPPDPANLRVYPRPDWYFLWYFSVLALIPAQAENAIILLGPALVGVMLILLPLVANKGERHPLRRPWAMAFVLVLVVMIGTFWIIGETSPWSPKFDAKPLPPALSANTNPQVVTGERLFGERGCQFCHVVANGVEGGLRGPNLANVGNRLSQAQITTRILNGGNNMPAYSTALKPDEINALVAFLQTRKTNTESFGVNNNNR